MSLATVLPDTRQPARISSSWARWSDAGDGEGGVSESSVPDGWQTVR